MSSKYKIIAINRESKNSLDENEGQIPLQGEGNRFQRLLQKCKINKETVVMPNVNRGQPINLRQDLQRMSQTIDRLIAGTSINATNRRTLELLANKCKECQKVLNEGDLKTSAKGRSALLQDWLSLREWYFFVIQNQEYRAPSHQRENTVYQGGLLNIPQSIKYIRSEMNTQAFGEEYDRDVVLINSESSDSFVGLASKYVTYSPSKNFVSYRADEGSLISFVQDGKADSLIEITIDSEDDLLIVLEEIKQLANSPLKDSFNGGIYIRTKFMVTKGKKQELQNLVNSRSRDIQILLEEPYDSLNSGTIFFSKVSLFHNGKDRRRYQLLQDAASMGYRPSISDVFEYFHQSDRLNDNLSFEGKTEDDIVSRRGRIQTVEGEDRREMERDYQVLLDTIENIKSSLMPMESASEIDKQILADICQNIEAVKSELKQTLAKKELQVTEVSFTFHDSYYKIRTLVQYAARLTDNCNPASFHEINRQMGKREGSLVLTTNSGMSATRTAITHLAGDSKALPAITKVYSTPHYWETDFLIENIFASNPHYLDIEDPSKSRLTMFKPDASKKEIEAMVDKVLSENAECKGAQMVCLDQSISPFFYTESFDLLHFAKILDINSDRIKEPIYLVVDNTLDFERITAETLFPSGVPKNVFLIFTTSMAKMHQLGLDAAAGGVINIHCNKYDQPQAEALYTELEAKLSVEWTAQDGYNQRLLDMLFYQRYDNGTMKNYLDYMVRKRQRNTSYLINGLRLGLRDSLVEDPNKSGMYHYRSPLTGTNKLQIQDDKDPAVIHDVDFSFHYDPESKIHGYITMIENAENNHVAGRVFEEIKRRVFERAALRGIHLSDGTSWGFPITRIDWYMHTMRIAMGLQHKQTMHVLGVIMAGVINELFISPEDFLKGAEIMPLRGEVLEERADELLVLDRLIPHDPSNPTTINYYTEPREGADDFSFYVREGDKMAGFVYAYAKEEKGERIVYLSKTSVIPEQRQNRYFRRMLMHLWVNARQMGVKKIRLHTSASANNEGVVKAYERCGFKVTGLVTEMQKDGWPLIKVEMEANVEGSPYEEVEHFKPVPNEVYQQINEFGDLTIADKYKPK